MLEPGTRLGTTYTVEAFLGAGAYGQVYRVTHRYLGQQALKVFPPGALPPTQDFFHEARVLVSLTHPNIVRVFDANVVETPAGPLPYLAMEYIDGETLGSVLRRRVRLGLAEATALARDLTEGLSEAHQLDPPLLHLDLTTENVMVTRYRGRLHAKIADFGIAAQVHPTTHMARAQGTLYYMAPEMFWGYATPASDVFMLGFLIYWLYAGVPPYPTPTVSSEASTRDLADAIQGMRLNPAPPLARFRMDIPQPLADLVAKALSMNPDQRYPNAHAFWVALRTL